MKLSSLNSFIPFQAHSYKVASNGSVITVRTDNSPYLGEHPVLVSKSLIPSYGQEHIDMGRNGKYYFVDIPTSYGSNISYHICYPDTRKKDTNAGRNYVVKGRPLIQKANEHLRKLYNQPLIHAIKSGKASGKLVYTEDIDNDCDKLNAIKEPTILVANSYTYKVKNPNIVGLILTSDDSSTFSHFSTQLRNRFDICGAVFSQNFISRLKNLNGNNLEISLNDNHIEIKKTNQCSSRKKYPTINIPKLKYHNKPLTTSECTPDVIGAKAVNIAKLEKMAQAGIIDCIIPKSIALPYGYIDYLLDGSDGIKKYNEINKEKYNQLKKFMKNNGINARTIMIRSSFNGEDLPNYPAAGLYDSKAVLKDAETGDYLNSVLHRAINAVANSKNNQETIEINSRYNIKQSDIKPGIVIQNKIDADYTFTLYSDDGNGNIKIDLFSRGNNSEDGKTQPHIFSYNKNTDVLRYEAIEMPIGYATFDQNGEIVECSEVEGDLSQNKKILALIKKLCKNAMIVERKFGAPQDIEGGLKDNDIYLWQTRNIVG